MNKKKSLYEAPTTKVLVVRCEGGILTGSDKLNPKIWEAGQSGWFEDDDD